MLPMLVTIEGPSYIVADGGRTRQVAAANRTLRSGRRGWNGLSHGSDSLCERWSQDLVELRVARRCIDKGF
jgi:hypothetical protein